MPTPAVDPAGIAGFFAELPDPRRTQGTRHPLGEVIALAILGVLCGADDWTEVEDVAKAKQDWLKTFLTLPHGVPSHDTFGRVFARLDPRAFERRLVAWIEELVRRTGSRLIRIDGKTARRSGDARSGDARSGDARSGDARSGDARSGDAPSAPAALHLVNAWCSANRIVLGQVAAGDKSNEIAAIPELLDLLSLDGAVVTIDAIGTQKAIAERIRAGGGDYLLRVKKNQPNLHRQIRLFFDDAIRHDFAGAAFAEFPHRQTQQTNGGHGRVETRRLWSVGAIDWLAGRADWAGLRSIVCLEATRRPKHGPKHGLNGAGAPSTERRYYVSSLPADDAPALLEAARGHWSVENSLHWSLDVAFREDDSRARTGHAAENLAAVRRGVLGLLKNDMTFKAGLKRKRKRCAMDGDYLQTVLSRRSE